MNELLLQLNNIVDNQDDDDPEKARNQPNISQPSFSDSDEYYEEDNNTILEAPSMMEKTVYSKNSKKSVCNGLSILRKLSRVYKTSRMNSHIERKINIEAKGVKRQSTTKHVRK